MFSWKLKIIMHNNSMLPRKAIRCLIFYDIWVLFIHDDTLMWYKCFRDNWLKNYHTKFLLPRALSLAIRCPSFLWHSSSFFPRLKTIRGCMICDVNVFVEIEWIFLLQNSFLPRAGVLESFLWHSSSVPIIPWVADMFLVSNLVTFIVFNTLYK